jgi:hypothetical protein
MMRSTELCEMSRSCQSAMFSNAAPALARTTRARPQTCSLDTGLRLCGMAELPRCSGAERLFGLAHFGALQVADLEGDFFERGREDRQRGEILRVAVALNHLRSDRSHGEAQPLADGSSTSGPDATALPTAPEIFPTAICRAAWPKRSRLRRFSANQLATFRPKVIGSACTPCVRPICGVC